MYEKLISKAQKYFKTDVRYLIRGGFWLVIGQAVASLSGFFLAIVFANLVAPEQYGVYKYVISTLGLLLIPSLSGMNTSMTQAISRGVDGEYTKAFRTRIAWGSLGALGSIVLGFYYIFQHNMMLGSIFLIISPFIPFFDSLTQYYSLLHGRQRFGNSTVSTSLTQILATIAIIIAIVTTRDIFVIIITYVASWTLFRFIAYIIARRQTTLNDNKDPNVISYGKHLTLMSIVGLVAQQLDKILLFQFIGATQLAQYALLTAMPDQIKSLFKNSQILIIPKYASQSKEDVRKSIRAKWVYVIATLIFVTAAYIVLAPIVFKFLFPKYLAVIGLSQLYALTIIGLIIVLPLAFFQSQAATRQLYYYNLIRSIAQIVFLFVGIYWFGLVGAVWSRIASELFGIILAEIISRKY